MYICVLVHDRYTVDQQVDIRLAVKVSFLCWCWLHALDSAMSRDELPKWFCAVGALSTKRVQNGALYTAFLSLSSHSDVSRAERTLMKVVSFSMTRKNIRISFKIG